MVYKSSTALLGLPLVHIATGEIVEGQFRRGIAKGWIAIGDISFGILLSIGGFSLGGIAIGGFSLGAVAVAGLSMGIWSLGGLTLGLWAAGGAALAVFSALGGLAVAGGCAEGGVAIAANANNALSKSCLEANLFFVIARTILDYSALLWVLPVIILIAGLLRKRSHVNDAK